MNEQQKEIFSKEVQRLTRLFNLYDNKEIDREQFISKIIKFPNVEKIIP